MLYILIAASVLSVASMAYIYNVRGAVRYASVREYMRKGWPIFAPFNCLLYLFTQQRGQKVFMDLKDFPELAPLQANWQVIRDEVLALHQGGYFNKTTDPSKAAYFDVGFRTFYKYGWSKFYLNWYGHTHESALALCPNTVRLVNAIPTVNGAMFTVLPPGAQLTRHLDPMAVSLRYHLGLSTPNTDNCFINVDGQSYSWRDGQAALFDVTYLHFARNETDTPRLILMCDVQRPLSFVGKAVNFFYRALIRLTVVPNIEGDTQGFANRVFSSVAPAFARTKALKKSNRPLYTVIKYLFNGTLLAIFVGLVYGLVVLVKDAL